MTGEQKIERCRTIVAEWTAATIDGVLVDAFTASHLIQVYDSLNESNRTKMCEWADTSIVVAVDRMWKVLDRVQGRVGE